MSSIMKHCNWGGLINIRPDKVSFRPFLLHFCTVFFFNFLIYFFVVLLITYLWQLIRWIVSKIQINKKIPRYILTLTAPQSQYSCKVDTKIIANKNVSGAFGVVPPRWKKDHDVKVSSQATETSNVCSMHDALNLSKVLSFRKKKHRWIKRRIVFRLIW